MAWRVMRLGSCGRLRRRARRLAHELPAVGRRRLLVVASCGALAEALDGRVDPCQEVGLHTTQLTLQATLDRVLRGLERAGGRRARATSRVLRGASRSPTRAAAPKKAGFEDDAWTDVSPGAVAAPAAENAAQPPDARKRAGVAGAGAPRGRTGQARALPAGRGTGGTAGACRGDGGGAQSAREGGGYDLGSCVRFPGRWYRRPHP